MMKILIFSLLVLNTLIALSQGQTCPSSADIVFVLDFSGSIHQNEFNTMLKAVESFVVYFKMSPAEMQFGVFAFNDFISERIIHLNDFTNKSLFLDELMKYDEDEPEGGTRTDKALEYLRNNMFTKANGDRDIAPNAAVIITDGKSNRAIQTEEEALKLKEAGILLISIGIGNRVDVKELELIASGKDYVFLTKFLELSSLTESFINKTCELFADPCILNPCKNGGTCKHQPTGHVCDCPSGYIGFRCEITCSPSADIVFALDCSGSIHQNEFNTMLKAVESFVVYFKMSPAEMQFGVFAFNDFISERIIHLNDFTNKSLFLDDLMKYSGAYTEGGTRTDKALEYLRNNMFTKANGDRDTAPNAAVIISDGKSNRAIQTEEEALKLKEAGILLISICIGNGVDVKELELIASGKDCVFLTNFTELSSLAESFINKTCELLTDPCNSNPCINGGTCTRQQTEYVCECPNGFTGAKCEIRCVPTADIVFALDRSGSVSRSDFNKLFKAVEKFIMNFDITPENFHFGFFAYNDFISKRIIHLNDFSNRSSFIAEMVKFNKRKPNGGSRTDRALNHIRNEMFTEANGDRDTAQNFALLITDGKSNRPSLTEEEARKLKDTNINVIAIGIGDEVDVGELQSIATRENDSFFTNFSMLPKLVGVVATKICNISLDPCSSNPCKNGGTCRPYLANYICDCPDIYRGAKCEIRCVPTADIVFALDRSGSVSRSDFNKLFKAVEKFIMNFDITPENFHFGFFAYNDFISKKIIHLNDFSNRSSFIAEMVKFNKGKPNGGSRTDRALNHIRNEMFTEANGDRDTAQNFALLITDGKSNRPSLTEEEARKLKDTNINVIAIGIGDEVDVGELQSIATRENDSFFTNFSMLPKFVGVVATKICNISLDPCSSNPCKNGGTCRPYLANYICDCPDIYRGAKCEIRCVPTADIVFALDRSGSVSRSDFNKLFKAVEKFIMNFDITPENFHFGFFAYNDFISKKIIHLNDFSNRSSFIAEMVKFNKGKPNGGSRTDRALNHIRNEMFTEANGDRDTAQNFALLITDGKSNRPSLTEEEARKLKDTNINVIAIGIGDEVDVGELQSIATRENDSFFTNFSMLPKFVGVVATKICNISLDPCSSNPCENGGTCRPYLADYICDCPDGYVGVECEFECSPSADIVFVLDFSGSIHQSDLNSTLKFVESFVMNFDVALEKMQFGVFAFNNNISERIIRLNDSMDRKSFVAELIKYEDDYPGGGSRIDVALDYLRIFFNAANGDRDAAPNIALILTNSQSSSRNLTEEAAFRLENTNIQVITIGTGNGVDMQELGLIATRKCDVFLTNFTALSNLVDTLVNKTCKVSTNPCSLNPCKNGGICKPFFTEYICDCSHGYIGINCETKCDISADIMIVIDESGSISRKNFNKMIDAVMLFIKTLDISKGKVRLGIITFALNITVHYNLDAFDNKLDMLSASNLLRYRDIGGPTFTHKALEYLRRFSFSPQRGDRPDYPNYVVFFIYNASPYPWKTMDNAKLLLRSGASVYAIGLGQRVSRGELYHIASKLKRQHMVLTSFRRAESKIKLVLAQACKDLKAPCIKCTHTQKCLQGMKCCNGCCQDTVTLFGLCFLHTQMNTAFLNVQFVERNTGVEHPESAFGPRQYAGGAAVKHGDVSNYIDDY